MLELIAEQARRTTGRGCSNDEEDGEVGEGAESMDRPGRVNAGSERLNQHMIVSDCCACWGVGVAQTAVNINLS